MHLFTVTKAPCGSFPKIHPFWYPDPSLNILIINYDLDGWTSSDLVYMWQSHTALSFAGFIVVDVEYVDILDIFDTADADDVDNVAKLIHA